jgi:hypothetical protein
MWIESNGKGLFTLASAPESVLLKEDMVGKNGKNPIFPFTTWLSKETLVICYMAKSVKFSVSTVLKCGS